MEATKPKRKQQHKGRAPKWNWELIFRDVDLGGELKALAAKYSVPVSTLRDKINARNRQATLVAKAKGEAVAEVLGRAALSETCVALHANSAPLTAPPTLTETPELTESELLTLLADPAAILALKPEDAQALLAKRTQMLLLQGFATVEAPTSIKDLTSLAKLWREASGLSAKEGKGGGGLLAPVRSGGRRMVTVVQEAEVLETEVEEVIDWPEGM